MSRNVLERPSAAWSEARLCSKWSQLLQHNLHVAAAALPAATAPPFLLANTFIATTSTATHTNKEKKRGKAGRREKEEGRIRMDICGNS